MTTSLLIRIKVICLATLMAIGHNTHAQNADIRLLRNITGHRERALDKTMAAVSKSAYPVIAAIPVAELITAYATHNDTLKRQGWQTVAAIGINTILTTGLKYGIDRTRPYVKYNYLQAYERDETGHSFPSGHTSYAFCAATSLSICFPRWYVIVPSYGWATVVGYSRLHLAEHYPTDVLAGAVVGAGSAWLAYKGNQWLQHRKVKRAEHD